MYYKIFFWSNLIFHRRISQSPFWGFVWLTDSKSRQWEEAWSAFRLSCTHHMLLAFRLIFVHCWAETPEFRAFPVRIPLRINLFFFLLPHFWELRLRVYFCLRPCISGLQYIILLSSSLQVFSISKNFSMKFPLPY